MAQWKTNKDNETYSIWIGQIICEVWALIKSRWNFRNSKIHRDKNKNNTRETLLLRIEGLYKEIHVICSRSISFPILNRRVAIKINNTNETMDKKKHPIHHFFKTSIFETNSLIQTYEILWSTKNQQTHCKRLTHKTRRSRKLKVIMNRKNKPLFLIQKQKHQNTAATRKLRQKNKTR